MRKKLVLSISAVVFLLVSICFFSGDEMRQKRLSADKIESTEIIVEPLPKLILQKRNTISNIPYTENSNKDPASDTEIKEKNISEIPFHLTPNRYEDGDLTGYNGNFNFYNGSYSQYDTDTIKIMAVQKDLHAQIMLAHRLYEDKEMSMKWFIEAANNGYTMGYDQAASLYLELGNKVMYGALSMLARDIGPEDRKSLYPRRLRILTDSQMKEAERLYMELN